MDRKTKKIVLAVTLSAVAAILITVAVLGVIIYHDYKEMHAKQQAIIKAQQDYEAPNFKDEKSTYIKTPDNAEVTPGESMDFEIFYKNAGPLDALELKIGIYLPDNLELVESSLDGLDYKVSYGSLIVTAGDVPSGRSGSLSLRFKVRSPLDNGTEIESLKVKLNYYKESKLIGKKGVFNYEFESGRTFTVASSPDFSSSGISFKEVPEDISRGDPVSYAINIENTGNMDASDVVLSIKGLEDLSLNPEENSGFNIDEGIAALNLGVLRAGEKKELNLYAALSDEAQNNAVVAPVMIISFAGNEFTFKAPEIVVTLYPAFDKSTTQIIPSGVGGNYSGDAVDVIVNVKNTGEIEADNVIVKLIMSNLFVLNQGEQAWNVAKLAIGEVATFKTSLKIIEGVVKDTYADCHLNISSDQTEEIQAGSSRILISGEKPFTRNVIPIVALHGIEPSPSGLYELSTQEFDFLCGTLKALGYKTISFMELLSYFDSGKKLPEKPVILTSDDGYYSIYANAFPILKKYGYKMTVFLVTGLIGNSNEDRHLNEFDLGKPDIPERPMLIWPEVAAMSRYGIEFQSHTVSHRKTGELSGNEVYFELAQSKADIEGHLNKPCVFIAWPFDNYSNSFIPLLPQIGYRGAIRYKGGVEDVRSINIYAIKRIPFYSSTGTSNYAPLMGLN
ncbi:MAG: Poly-beta-1,6-N-acetyl-D-glucosamine N-deacetylase precursor [Actinobacteria bacterium ADurb.Bin346]|nr:MAG: Poly-beta-1,6-N-acetyl-D-glucosamine N-deacetylase precursor [Actinobacteria bacterium ADurb.Bin346]